MHRQKITELFRNYQSLAADAHEAEMVAATLAFVSEHPNCLLRSELVGHLTGSAWIVDLKRTQTLLTHHRKLDRWLQLGGHADGDPDLLAVAVREGKEESGLISLKVISEIPFDIDRHWIPERKGEPRHYHYDLRFMMEADPNEPLVVTHESNALKWIPLSLVPTLTREESITRMVRKTARLAV